LKMLGDLKFSELYLHISNLFLFYYIIKLGQYFNFFFLKSILYFGLTWVEFENWLLISS
jgi:hypothetical protein